MHSAGLAAVVLTLAAAAWGAAAEDDFRLPPLQLKTKSAISWREVHDSTSASSQITGKYRQREQHIAAAFAAAVAVSEAQPATPPPTAPGRGLPSSGLQENSSPALNDTPKISGSSGCGTLRGTSENQPGNFPQAFAAAQDLDGSVTSLSCLLGEAGRLNDCGSRTGIESVVGSNGFMLFGSEDSTAASSIAANVSTSSWSGPNAT